MAQLVRTEDSYKRIMEQKRIWTRDLKKAGIKKPRLTVKKELKNPPFRRFGTVYRLYLDSRQMNQYYK